MRADGKVRKYLESLQEAIRINAPAPTYENPLGQIPGAPTFIELHNAAEALRPAYTNEAEVEIRKKLYDFLTKD